MRLSLVRDHKYGSISVEIVSHAKDWLFVLLEHGVSMFIPGNWHENSNGFCPPSGFLSQLVAAMVSFPPSERSFSRIGDLPCEVMSAILKWLNKTIKFRIVLKF